MSNANAGHVSTIPYLLASVTVPLFGHLLTLAGESWYEFCCGISLLSVLLAHVVFLLMNELCVDAQGQLTHFYVVIIPIVLIGFGHSLTATLLGPAVNKVVPDLKL